MQRLRAEIDNESILPMTDLSTLMETLEAAAAHDPLVAVVLAESRAAGEDWPGTLERLVLALQADRAKLARELLPFRRHGVKMVPVLTLEEVSRHGFDHQGREPESGEWIPVQLPPAPDQPQ